MTTPILLRLAFYDEITATSAQRFVETMAEVKLARYDQLVLMLSSVGGSVFAVPAMLAALGDTGRPIVVVNVEQIASAALMLYLHASANRLCRRDATFLAHPVFGEPNSRGLSPTAELIDEWQQRTARTLAAAGMPPEVVERTQREDVQFGAEDALRWRVATGLVEDHVLGVPDARI